MKTFRALTFVLLTVLICDLEANGSLYADTPRRVKRQDDSWSWGTAPGPVTNAEVTAKSNVLRNSNIEDDANTTTTEAPTTPNPCSYQEPKVPDFSAPGRRISEVKCYEYIYTIKLRDDKESNAQACKEQIKKKHPWKGGGGHAVGGRDALPGEFPHMGAIGWQAAVGGWIFKCGGSLISDKYVLTAAHCSKASERDTSISDVEPKIVRLGDKNIDDGIIKVHRHGSGLNVTKTIKRVIDHPNYKAPKKYFDIALIELVEAVEFNKYIQPACLGFGDGSVLVGQKATLTGWGVIEPITRKTSPVLQAAVVDIFASELCDKLLTPSCNRHWCKMEEHQLCAGKLEGDVDACQGDSGGPLQVKISLPATTKGRMYHVVGVTSFGIGCALPNLPGIYTRVASFVDWIEGIVWN